MTEIQNPKPCVFYKKAHSRYVWGIEYWSLKLICNLMLGIWDLEMQH